MSKKLRRIVIPLSPDDRWAILDLPLPMSEDDWQQMFALFDVMKPGLVTAARPAACLDCGDLLPSGRRYRCEEAKP